MRASAPSSRFIVQELAGSGCMGSVYRALDAQTGARVALKIIASEGTEISARLEAEAEALAALRHPAIVRFIAFGTRDGGKPFLAMEWLDGEDLDARLARGRLTPAQVIDVGERVAEALAAAHARGILHRDIKPSNILLPGGRFDQATVVDFGIARLGSARRITPNDALLGTPGYMAPEQARGSNDDIDARADIFSLGAVLFEALTGRPAFCGEHTMAVLAKLLLDDPPRVSALCPRAPPALASLIDGMLAKDRSRRPQRAEDVADALRAIALELDAEGGAALAAASDPSAPRALTGGEQRLVSVVAAKPARHALRELEAALEPLGARVDCLMDGSILATWMSADAPTEQATRAARGALLIEQLVPGAIVAVASGLSDVSQPRPVGQALDRAARLLAAPTEQNAARIRLDTIVTGLLAARFRIAAGALGAELLGEDDIDHQAKTLLGRPTPCVGRDRELSALSDLLDECVSESAARAVLITGPAGIGKSRLRHEFLRALRARREGVDVWQARGDPMTAGSTFSLLGAAIRATVNVPSGAPLAARREKLCERVARAMPAADRERVAAFLGEIMGAPFPDDHSELLRSARQSAAAMVDQIRRAWADFIAAECAARPVLLVLEDLHWGDAASVALLDATLGQLGARPLMILALGRPEVRDVFPKLWAGRRFNEIALGGLSRRAAIALATHVLGPSIDEARLAELVDRSDGNAFYLEEMIRAISEGLGDALPETVLAMVHARLEALTSDQRRALRAASVFGESF